MRLSSLASAVVALGLAGAAQAGDLRVTPTGLNLVVPAVTGAISLSNEGGDPLNLQVRVFRWRQVDGADVLEPTTSVIVSPPAATIQRGETYTVRVMRIAAAPLVAEESYRLLIDNIPAAAPSGAPDGIRIMLRTSLPVFFQPPGAAAQVRWTARRAGDRVQLSAANGGGRHLKLSNLRLTAGSVTTSFGQGLNGYVLPGQTVLFEAPWTGADRGWTVSADTDAGPLSADVALADD